MGLSRDEDLALQRQSRYAALAVAGAMLVWLAVQAFGAGLGLRWLVLIDLATLAAFVWALALAYRIWRRRRQS